MNEAISAIFLLAIGIAISPLPIVVGGKWVWVIPSPALIKETSWR